ALHLVTVEHASEPAPRPELIVVDGFSRTALAGPQLRTPGTDAAWTLDAGSVVLDEDRVFCTDGPCALRLAVEAPALQDARLRFTASGDVRVTLPSSGGRSGARVTDDS